jgi:hypothetical protein
MVIRRLDPPQAAVLIGLGVASYLTLHGIGVGSPWADLASGGSVLLVGLAMTVRRQ